MFRKVRSSSDGKSVTLSASGGGQGGQTGLYAVPFMRVVEGTKRGYVDIMPGECERLQTLPDNYTAGVSDRQRYRQLGNGWTVDVITHILGGIK